MVMTGKTVSGGVSVPSLVTIATATNIKSCSTIESSIFKAEILALAESLSSAS